MVKKFYIKLARLAETEDDVRASHSLDEAEDLHENKLAVARRARAHRKPADRTAGPGHDKPSGQPG